MVDLARVTRNRRNTQVLRADRNSLLRGPLLKVLVPVFRRGETRECLSCLRSTRTPTRARGTERGSRRSRTSVPAESVEPCRRSFGRLRSLPPDRI